METCNAEALAPAGVCHLWHNSRKSWFYIEEINSTTWILLGIDRHSVHSVVFLTENIYGKEENGYLHLLPALQKDRKSWLYLCQPSVSGVLPKKL